MIILDAKQMQRVVREAQPSNNNLHEMVDCLVHDYEGKCLGFGICEMICSFCGNEQRDIFPVPMKFPAECGNCHRMTCYQKEEGGE